MTNRRPFSLKLYRLLSSAAAPLVPLLLHARRGKEDSRRLDERFGRASLMRPAGLLAWLHGVSVGESLSLLPLIERLRDERPDVQVLVTSATRAAADILARRLPEGALHQYAPVDTPAAVDAFLDHWRPDLGVVVENELWPNLILGAAARGTRLAMVSARLSDVSFRNWSRAPGAARTMFAAFDLVLARDAEAAERLGRLGLRVDGLADMKLGAGPLPVDEDELGKMRACLGKRPVILAASTHPGEEAAVLERFKTVRAGNGIPLLIVVPRHIGRAATIADLARDLGLRVAARSNQRDPTGLDVYVADTMGEIGLWYRLARVAFLGGSLTSGLGGHNPLEPARLGCPVVSGDKVDNWPIFQDLHRAGGVVLIDGVEGLDPVFVAALNNPQALAPMIEKARAFVAERDAEAAQATARVMALLGP